MISRIWYCWTSVDKADEFELLAKNELFVNIKNRNVPGFKEIELHRRNIGDEVEFVTILRFESFESVKLFAGEDYEIAIVPHKVRELLVRWDDISRHYEVRVDRNTKL